MSEYPFRASLSIALARFSLTFTLLKSVLFGKSLAFHLESTEAKKEIKENEESFKRFSESSQVETETLLH